jgi:hypothetical protein
VIIGRNLSYEFIPACDTTGSVDNYCFHSSLRRAWKNCTIGTLLAKVFKSRLVIRIVHSADIQHAVSALEDAIACYAMMSCHLILNAFCQTSMVGIFMPYKQGIEYCADLQKFCLIDQKIGVSD